MPAKPYGISSLILWVSLLGTMMSPALSLSATPYQLNSTLIDESGQQVTLKRWQGKASLITMEYASCQFVCSAAVSTLMALQRRADDEHQDIEFLIISLDPEHDTPAAWRRYRQLRNLTRSNWHYLTPRPQDLPLIAGALGVRYWRDGETLMHDFRVLHVNPAGETVGILENYGSNWKTLSLKP